MRLAICVALCLTAHAFLSCRLHRDTGHEIGFVYEDFPLQVRQGLTSSLGGPLADDEVTVIKEGSRRELVRAYGTLPLRVTNRRDAFWTVTVHRSLPVRRSMHLPRAGETRALGRFGGHSEIDFDVVASAAIAFAPAGSSRAAMVEAIARGIGRTAAHELAHAILGPTAATDGRTDDRSYEYYSFARPSQFYGGLHWNGAWPALAQMLR